MKYPSQQTLWYYPMRYSRICIYLLILMLGISGGCSLPGSGTDTTNTPNMTGKGYISLPKNLGQKYYGFNIYRSDSKDGQFIKVNKDILSSRTTGDKDKIVFIDEPLQIGKIYYYYIEGISFAGKSERITPIFKAQPR